MPTASLSLWQLKKDSRYGAKRTEQERTFSANWTVIAFSQNRFIIP